MTVTYTHEVANARLGGFSNLLLRWRGSVYKLFYKEFIIYITLYVILSMSYRWIEHPDFKNYFEKLCLQFQSYTDLVPISFVLGFYVSIVVGRWWQQYESIPWPDRLMVILAANVHGPDYRGRLIRRTLVRYLSLAQVLTYRSISTAVFKRFPTIQHVIDAGFMTQTEYKQYENVKTENVKYFVPCVWFSNLLSKVRQEGRIYDDMTYQTILKELNDFRGNCGMLFSYDWISIPLVYTQVVTVAVYVFFMSTLLSRQYLDVTQNYPGHEVDLYVPIFTICQFFFYVGWLKVAEQLINPFGEDDDDFEVNFIIDRNLEISMLTVDNMYLTHPKLEKDIYWNNPNPAIPYTAAAANHKLDAFLGSTYDMSLHKNEMQFVGQAEAPDDNDNNHLDVNHNLIDVEKSFSVQETPVFVPGKSPQNKNTTNPINFWKRLTGRDQEGEAKKSLLGSDYSSLRVNTNTKEKSLNEKRDSQEGELETLFPQQDSDDDSDSDVGNSSSSDDEDSDVNHSQRRSSLSSEDENANKNETDIPTDSHRSLTVRKHSIDEPDDRPRAKKFKKSTLLSPQSPKNTSQNTNTKPRRPDLLVTNCIDNNVRKTANRSMFGKGKKSPKKKTNATKFVKRNDIERTQGGETEEERRNAQLRTIGMLKATKKKSVQALQRNARRVNYPGNAWLRYKYPIHWRPEIATMGDYASMTSGAEDHGKTENDSPFGSILSFGTSIPSPRPLRFSQFGKGQRRRRYLDSMSASSCLTSPCANEDYSPCFAGYNGSPKADYFQQTPHTPPTNPVSMPFTEDLRRRLLIVNTNTPSSSTAPSPTMNRAFAGSYQFTHTQGGATGSDDLLIIAPSETPTPSNNAWVGTLEAIGEIPRNEPAEEPTKESDISDKNEQKVTTKSDKESDNKTPEKTTTLAKKKTATVDNLPPLPTKVELEMNNWPKNILRSKSCNDVPVAKRNCSPPSETKKNIKIESESDSSDDEKSNSEIKETKSPITSEDIILNSNSPTRAAIHWESECNKTPTTTNGHEKIRSSPKRKRPSNPTSPSSSHSDVTTTTTQETENSDSTTAKPSNENDFTNESKVINDMNDEIVTFSSSQGFIPQTSQSDLGYYSAKEDVTEALAHSRSLDVISRIRNQPTTISNRYSFHAISESIKKMEESKETSSIAKMGEAKFSQSTQDCSVSDSVAVTTTPNPNDAVISIA